MIALTAKAMANQRELALATGTKGFAVKPFRLKVPVAAVSPWIRREAPDSAPTRTDTPAA